MAFIFKVLVALLQFIAGHAKDMPNIFFFTCLQLQPTVCLEDDLIVSLIL